MTLKYYYISKQAFQIQNYSPKLTLYKHVGSSILTQTLSLVSSLNVEIRCTLLLN